MVYPDTPLEQVVEQKSAIDEIAAQFEKTKQEAKNIMKAMTQFWGSVIQDEQLEQLTKQSQESEEQLETLKMALRTMPPIVHITQSMELKDLLQRVGKAQERQRKRNDQLDEFQEIGAQLLVKAVVVLQAVQEGKKEVNENMVENLLKQYFLRIQDLAEKIKTQVKEITQQYNDFKLKINEYTMSN